MKFRINRSTSTFLKYLVSYVLIFTVLILCFFLVLRSELTEAYGARQAERLRVQMEAAGNHLTSEIQFLNHTDRLIKDNADIKVATYQADLKYRRITNRELKQYADASSLIDGIVYYSRYTDHVYATKEYIAMSEGVFTFVNAAIKKLAFDPAPYLDADAGQLIWLEGEESQYLLWFPVNRSGAKYLYFYLLDTQLIQSQLNTLLSDEVLAVALLDGEGRCVTGSGFGPYEGAVEGKTPPQGVLPLENGTSLYISKPFQDGFTLATVVSGTVLKEQVEQAFVHSYLSLLGLGLVGVALVYVAMHLTYRPLQRLVKNLGHDTGRHQNYLELISRNHSELMTQKAQLEQALAEYREALAKDPQGEAEDLDYPHQELGQLTAALREKRIADARKSVEALLSRDDSTPVYFLGCVALDSLTLITNSMNRAHIDFDSYADVFSEAVRRCRNIRALPDVDEIKALIQNLLAFYEQQLLDRSLQVAPLKQFVEGRFRDPDFSIAEMAEAYSLSPSRMSSLFKAEMGVGFLDYVWNMRLEKGQQLLLETELSVDEISQAVGYLASTSFSRKFKQATGLTPSQYREKHVVKD